MKTAILFVTALSIVAMLHQGFSQPPLAYANGGPDARDLLDAPVGEYHLLVIASPGRPPTGAVHLTFSLMDRQKTAPVSGASISLIAAPPEGSEATASTYQAAQSSINPDLYDTNLTLDVTGDWELSIFVDGPLGKADAKLVLEVVERGSKVLAIVIVVGAFPALLLMLEVWRRWDRKRKRSNRRAVKE